MCKFLCHICKWLCNTSQVTACSTTWTIRALAVKLAVRVTLAVSHHYVLRTRLQLRLEFFNASQ